MKLIKGIFLGGAMALMSIGYAAEIKPVDVEADTVYQVKKGDTLSRVSQQLTNTAKKWRELATYNQLANPNLIEVGQTLKVKSAWAKDAKGTRASVKGMEAAAQLTSGQAIVEGVSGAVKVNGKLVRAGELLPAGAKLQTQQQSAIRLRLPDGSTINLMEKSSLSLEKLEQGPVNSFKTILRLLAGHLEAFKKSYSAGQSDLSVQSTLATIGVRGTHFRMRQLEGKNFAEIEEGSVEFDADKTPQKLVIAGGFGSVADGKNPAEIIPLLPAPRFPQLPAVFETPYVEWAMPELSGAQSYVGELAQDEHFSKNVRALEWGVKAINFTDLADGHYWLRVRAVDLHGLQGMETKLAFAVKVRPRVIVMIKAYIDKENLQLRWVGNGLAASYQVQVSNTQAFENLLLDEQTADSEFEMPRPASGRYFVRVRQISSDRHADLWDAPVMFEVH